jgi:hypothetical protein
MNANELASFDLDIPTKQPSSDSHENIGERRKFLQSELARLRKIQGERRFMPEMLPFIEDYRRQLNRDLDRLCNKNL